LNYAVIFAGGVGSRMNNNTCPKQFLEINNKPILIYTLEHFEKHPDIDAICLVCLSDWLDHAKSLVEVYGCRKVRWVVEGGSTAMESQCKGLEALRAAGVNGGEDIVLIHDGVRPLINEELITNCIAEVKAHGNAVTVSPAIETIIRADEDSGKIRTYPRSECLLARAPQAFFLRDIMQLHEKAKEDHMDSFVDSATMLLHYGVDIHMVEGPTDNIKVTNPSDFYICRALLEARQGVGENL